MYLISFLNKYIQNASHKRHSFRNLTPNTFLNSLEDITQNKHKNKILSKTTISIPNSPL